MTTPLIAPHELHALFSDAVASTLLRIVDCRFSLSNPAEGRAQFERSHIPRAVYASLDRDLSAPVVPGKTGRHPLPPIADLARRLGELGISNDSDVVVYDDASGAIAARLWWLLRYLGHTRVRLLDGGLQAWIAAGYPVTDRLEAPAPAEFVPRVRPELVVSAETVAALRGAEGERLFDARAPERYSGEVEPIDPVAGHIPGARSFPFANNLRDGRFLPPELVRAAFEEALAGVASERAVVYCGSGVTACHLLLAAEHAGLPLPKLYAGSFSEWISDPSRPVERSAERG
jgi:thiosulfate/3-mercaptopyruvate sulfurtransferase